MRVHLKDGHGFAVIDADVMRVERDRVVFRDEEGVIVGSFPTSHVWEVWLDDEEPVSSVVKAFETGEKMTTTRPNGCLCGMNSTIPCPLHNATYSTSEAYPAKGEDA